MWNGLFFEHVTLKSLGLRVQLGHDTDTTCSNPDRSFADTFTVIDNTAIHSILLDYCGCETAQTKPVQLLHASWYPATTTNPRTAATFRVLEHFHLLTFESKVSGFEQYYTLARATDNTGTVPVPVRSLNLHSNYLLTFYNHQDRYPAFMCMVREWRHIKLLKRSGCGHDPSGKRPKAGQCAVVCPAFPQPGRNLPEDWSLDGPNQYVRLIPTRFRLTLICIRADGCTRSS